MLHNLKNIYIVCDDYTHRWYCFFIAYSNGKYIWYKKKITNKNATQFTCFGNSSFPVNRQEINIY